MPNEEKRARDVDRERAVAFVEDAWIDGQLGVDEYRERMDRLFSAVTLGDLSAEVRDLQVRNGVDWSPEPEPVPVVPSDVAADRSSEIAVPAPASVAAPASKVDDGEVMIAVTLGVIVLVGALVLFAANGEDEGIDDDWASSAEFTSLLEPEGFAGSSRVRRTPWAALLSPRCG